MTWEVIARAFALKVVARKGPEISRKPMVKALMRVTPSIARWDELDELVSRFLGAKWVGVGNGLEELGM